MLPRRGAEALAALLGLGMAVALASLAGCGGERQAPPAGQAPSGAAAPAGPAATVPAAGGAPAGAGPTAAGSATATAAGEAEPPAAQPRAVAALAAARVVDLVPEPPKTIEGLGGSTGAGTSPLAGAGGGTGGEVKSIEGGAKDLESAMADLHAKTVGQEIHIELPADVLFDFDKADIRPDAATALAKAAIVIRAHPGRVRVEGHTDSKGKRAYNLELSERRARAVVRWLEEREGLRGTSFQARGFAETRPVAPNTATDGSDNPAGRQQNRRVEIVVGGASGR
jgi:outer membrane protein OmpA-like peptidoglycan-associated protein